jgi:hypothetical protein
MSTIKESGFPDFWGTGLSMSEVCWRSGEPIEVEQDVEKPGNSGFGRGYSGGGKFKRAILQGRGYNSMPI